LAFDGGSKQERAVSQKSAGELKANGMPKSQKLTGIEFLRVMAKGEKQSCPVCVAYFLPAEDFQSGISVSKKLGSAVVRNRVKRILSEAIRLSKRALSRPVHLVLVARQGAERLSLDQAKRILVDLYSKSRAATASRNA